MHVESRPMADVAGGGQPSRRGVPDHTRSPTSIQFVVSLQSVVRVHADITMMITHTAIAGSRCSASSLTRRSVKASAQNASKAKATTQLAASSLAGLLLIAQPAFALYPGAGPSGDRWDGESSALGSCKLGEAGDECRSAELAKDKLLSYGQVTNSGKISGSAAGVPVSNLDSKYAKETVALSKTLVTYMNLDPNDDSIDRQGIVKQVKKESLDWVSRYARGGSARAKSARTLYVVVDAVQGHVATNGFTPFPRNKAAKLTEEVNAALGFLEQGR